MAERSATAIRDDDSFHPPDPGDPLWTETCWFAFFVPERKLSGTLYPLFRPNQGVVASSVYLWDDTAHEPWSALYARNLWHVPMAGTDLTDLDLMGGLRYRCLEPAQRFAMGYEHAGELALDLQFDGVIPPHYLGEHHLDQPGRVTGTITYGGEDIAVDCIAMRDRSWSPRSDLTDTMMGSAGNGGYSYAQADAQLGFHALSAGSGDEVAVVAGYLVRDGELHDVVGGTRRVTAREDGRPQRVEIEVRDQAGRTLQAVGENVNCFAWQFTPNMFSWICLARWEIDGRTVWGEDHDNWNSATYRRFRRASGR
jgi:hypothetical protein